jgi:ABC-type lipoprotein export system ATPase subunit
VIQEMSVLENVMVSHLFGKKHAPSRSQLREEAERICRFLEIEDKMDTPREKLTIVERKRSMMARALGTNRAFCSSTKSWRDFVPPR